MKSRGSSRNKVRPVAVEPAPAAAAAAAADQLMMDTVTEAGHATTHQPVRPKPSRRRSHSGRVDKSESHSQQWSLRKGLSMLQKNFRSERVKTPKPAPVRCADTPEASRGNLSLTACATGMPCVQKVENMSIAGTGGALGLTPVTAMFKMQTITAVKPQGNQVSTGKKRKAKESTKTPAKRHAKRQILGTLNQTEISASEKKPTPVQQTAPIVPSYTFRKRRSDLSDTVERQTSLGSMRFGGTLSREWSTGTMRQTLDEIDMNLETSIMNTLYPDGKTFMMDEDESVLNDSMYSADSSQDDTLPEKSGQRNRLRRCNSMRLMQRNLSSMLRTSPRLSQTINLGHELQSPNVSGVEDSGETCRSTVSPSCANGKNILEDSYIKAQMEALVKTPADGSNTRKLEVKQYRALSARIARRVSPVEKACIKKAAENSTTPRCSGQPIRRSRSLRMWGKEEGAVVTGYAGSTPKPQRRRPSANERLIM